MAANKEKYMSVQIPSDSKAWKSYASIMKQYKDSGGDQMKKIDVVYSCPCNLFVITGYKDLSEALLSESSEYPYGEIGRVKNVIPHERAFEKGYSYNIGII